MTDAYWSALARDYDVTQVRMLFEQRVREFTPIMLPLPEAIAIELLDRLTADGLLEKEERETEDGVEIVYVRKIAQSRVVDWVVALHGMNTTGAWQETFSWLLGTTWGRSVPVAIYKYGIVIAGVILFWRRNKLREQLRRKLDVLAHEARARGFNGNPDVVAHSFGTWLFGHLLQLELQRPAEERLTFGRVILAGCILPPDFDWKAIKDAGLVEDVLNHYGTADAVVPWARWCIADSGPSGKRGFDSDEVIDVRAEGYGHSDLFLRDLRHVYEEYWKPFLTLPPEALRSDARFSPPRKSPRTPGARAVSAS
ncbi:MAG: hypothetical protein ACJ74H_03340 [Thermoanaerobaculia bacterium]